MKKLVLVCLLCAGCTQFVTIDKEKVFVVFPDGAVGESNDPLRFPKPLVVMRQPFPLEVGMFAVRHDHYLLKDVFVMHQVVEVRPDGTYLLQGFNRKTNPKPDVKPLTRDNYIGIAYPVSTP